MGRHRTIEDKDLLRIARGVFEQRGHAASTRDVAQAAGISQAVLFQRFGSKRDLFFAAMEPAAPDLETLLGGLDTSDGKRCLAELCRRLLGYFEAIMPSILHLLTHPDFDSRQFHQHGEIAAQMVAGVAGRIRALQERGLVAPVDAEAAADLLLASLHSLAMTGSSPQQIERWIDVLWAGLKP
jgi:AcrR family transcriptional regulator